MTEKRRLTSNKDRALLWYAADGKCPQCGEPLPDEWHADHIIPYKVTKQTNVHEMQALCPKCNLKKGDKMLRLHQNKMLEICRNIKAQVSHPKEIVAYVTPGGGKSVLANILAAELIPTFADALCWVVPRDNLKEQGEKIFTDQLFRMMLRHNYRIRQSMNEVDPCRDTQGCIITYQSVVSYPDLWRQELSRKRYILFLDEPHHVVSGGLWHRALQPMVDRAELVVYASGTLDRGDNKPIAFLPYRLYQNGQTLDLDKLTTIHYTRADALAEDAIVPLHFEIHNGRAEWIDRQGDLQSIESFSDEGIDVRAALSTALQTSYAYDLIGKGIKHWQGHKQRVYTKAKLLIVCPNIFICKQYQEWLTKMGLENVRATSDDSPEAKQAIGQFKGKKGVKEVDVMLTVGMAYEGLDVPEITHVICLTLIRTKAWLEQCFARANRTAKGKQYGVIFAPDDEDFQRVIDEIKAEQARVIKIPDYVGNNGGGNGGNEVEIVPLTSELTDGRAAGLDTGEEVDYSFSTVLAQAAEECDLVGYSTVQLNNFFSRVQARLPIHQDAEPFPNAPMTTPSEQEQRLKNAIDRQVKRYCYHTSAEFSKVNGQIKQRFNKPRDQMTIKELTEAWRYVRETFRLPDDDNS